MDNFELRTLKDFLTLCNKISETCFIHCVNQLGDMDLSQDETRCVDVCIRKYGNVNYKVSQVYMEIQPQLIKKRIEDMNKEQAALAAKVNEINSNEKSSGRTIEELNKQELVSKAEVNDR